MKQKIFDSISSAFSIVIIAGLFTWGTTEALNHGEKLRNNTPHQSLTNGVCGNFSIKLTTINIEGTEFVTREKTLDNIQWGKIEVTPLVGSIPTFFYIEAGSNQLKQ